MRKAEFEKQLAVKQHQQLLRKVRSTKKLIEEANRRILEIDNAGLESAAVRSRLGNSDNLERAFFSIPENATREDLIALTQEVRSFLNDPTSALTGARLYSYEIMIGDWKERHQKPPEGINFDEYNALPISTGNNEKNFWVDKDYAKIAYSAYRSAIEMEQLANESMYDSETMIQFTFSYIESRGITELNDDTRGEVAEQLRKYTETLKKYREDEYNRIYGGINAPVIR